MSRGRVLGLELAAFFALAWFAAAHWADGLVARAPAGRVLGCVVVAAAAGLALALTAGVSARMLAAGLRTAAAAAGIGAGAVAIGFDRGLLRPGRWGEAADGIDRGLAALGTVQWPYDGPEPWARLVLLLAIPLALSLAAAFAFWPTRDGGRRLRPVGLVLILALYGTAVTEHQFTGEIARGAALLVLVAAWLWMPRMPLHGPRAALVAAGAVAVACFAALPAAARYEEREPWLDYESWNPFAAGAATKFDWSHSYGPIDWPRDGTTLLNVRSEKRHYWRVQTLDRFDGFRWVRSRAGRGNPPLLPEPYRREWQSRLRVTIRDLDTNLFPVAGTAVRISGADPVIVQSEDGTVEAVGESLDEGDSYAVEAYVPDPSPEEMRGATEAVPHEVLAPATAIQLPPAGTDALEGYGVAGDAARSAAEGEPPATVAELEASPYRRVLGLARRLAAARKTRYDVVRSIQRHLRSEYRYSERPPSQEFPLAAFLFEDRRGYCQQFSGAMALMLRMVGIPARVAAGFTPGSYNRDTREYRVRDLDAHSWVEVWFTGVGWVAFDPTPSVAPAESQSGIDDASASSGAGGGETPDGATGELGPSLSERAGAPGPASRDDGVALAAWKLLAALVLLAVVALAVLRLRAIAWRRRPREADRELAELRRILARYGEELPAATTLRQLEERLARTAGAPAARYVRALRERRYGARGAGPPGRSAERELRRALARQRPLRRRLVAAVAVPGPFRRG